MYDDFSFINITQKSLKPSKKMFQFPVCMRKKNSYLGISDEGYWWKHEMQVASKKVYWKKQQSVPNTCHISPLKKIVFSEQMHFSNIANVY